MLSRYAVRTWFLVLVPPFSREPVEILVEVVALVRGIPVVGLMGLTVGRSHVVPMAM